GNGEIGAFQEHLHHSLDPPTSSSPRENPQHQQQQLRVEEAHAAQEIPPSSSGGLGSSRVNPNYVGENGGIPHASHCQLPLSFSGGGDLERERDDHEPDAKPASTT
ncbi:unnamed protein product, partial [Amoebophrya sp. A25]